MEDKENLIDVNEHNIRVLLQLVLGIMTNEQLEILKKELTKLENELDGKEKTS